MQSLHAGARQLLGGLAGQEVGTEGSPWNAEQEQGGKPQGCRVRHLLGLTSIPGCLLHYSMTTGMQLLRLQSSGFCVSVQRTEMAPKHQDAVDDASKLIVNPGVFSAQPN